MADITKYFAAFKHIAPSDMEYYLEEMASNGYILEPLAQSGMFFLKFAEGRPERIKYVVDVTGLQKHLYMKTLIDKGWEYMGQVMNCHVWKMAYKDGERPADFADQRCIRGHCIRMGAAFAVVAVLMLLLFAGYIYLIYSEHAAAAEVKHDVLYAILAVIQIPFTVFFAILAAKLFREAGNKKNNLERDFAFKQAKAAKKDTDTVEADNDEISEEYREEEHEKAGDNHQD